MVEHYRLLAALLAPRAGERGPWRQWTCRETDQWPDAEVLVRAGGAKRRRTRLFAILHHPPLVHRPARDAAQPAARHMPTPVLRPPAYTRTREACPDCVVPGRALAGMTARMAAVSRGGDEGAFGRVTGRDGWSGRGAGDWRWYTRQDTLLVVETRAATGRTGRPRKHPDHPLGRVEPSTSLYALETLLAAVLRWPGWLLTGPL